MNVTIAYANLENRQEAVSLEKTTNEFLKDHPGATVEWLQSSSAAQNDRGLVDRVTILTAIVTFDQ